MPVYLSAEEGERQMAALIAETEPLYRKESMNEPQQQTNEKGTKYIVLQGSEDGTTWALAGASKGSADKAIKAAAHADGNGTYVAIPARSWKPVKVTVSTETVVKLG
jgi:hypothetical protein